MALEIHTGNIMDNWDKCDIIYLSAHLDINPNGDYYLNNEQISIVKNLIPDFNEVFTKKVIEVKEVSKDKDTNEQLFGFVTKEVEHDGVKQNIGLFFSREKWNGHPRPDVYKMFLDAIFTRVSYLAMLDMEVPRIVIQCPITADIPPTKKGIEAIERLYNFYPPFAEIWQPLKP